MGGRRRRFRMLYPSNQKSGHYGTVEVKKALNLILAYKLYVAYRNSLAHNTTQRHGNDTPPPRKKRVEKGGDFKIACKVEIK